MKKQDSTRRLVENNINNTTNTAIENQTWNLQNMTPLFNDYQVSYT